MRKSKKIKNDTEAVIAYAKMRLGEELKEKLKDHILEAGDRVRITYDAVFDEALSYFESTKEKGMNLDQLEFKLIELQGEVQKERERDNEKKLMLARLKKMEEESSWSMYEDGEKLPYSTHDRRVGKLCRVWNTRENYWKEVYVSAVIKRKMFGAYKIIGFLDQYDRRWDKAEVI